MLVKILGGIDVLAGLILLFGGGFSLPSALLIFLGLILGIKSFLGMLQDFASWIDLLSGAALVLSSLWDIPILIMIILGILLLQKGVVSFL